MGGDLNLKKSWHPVLMSNQKKVWEEEQRALEERKRIDQLKKERQQERQIQELQQLQEASGGRQRLARVDWMYSGPASGQTGTTEELEGYLLGKRRIDGLLKGSESQQLQKSSKEDSFMAVQNANTARDTAAKIRDDPMLAIKKQEQATYEAMMNDPVKRRLMLKAAGASDSLPSEAGRERRNDHCQTRDSHERRLRHISRRHKRREDHSKSRRYLSKRSYNSSPPRSRSHSPWRSRRSVSPYRQRAGSSATKDDPAAKLAAMQDAASELDQDRERRLAAMTAMDRQQTQREDTNRARTARSGGRADFINTLNRKVVGDLDLGDRLCRGKSGVDCRQEAY